MFLYNYVVICLVVRMFVFQYGRTALAEYCDLNQSISKEDDQEKTKQNLANDSSVPEPQAEVTAPFCLQTDHIR